MLLITGITIKIIYNIVKLYQITKFQIVIYKFSIN